MTISVSDVIRLNLRNRSSDFRGFSSVTLESLDLNIPIRAWSFCELCYNATCRSLICFVLNPPLPKQCPSAHHRPPVYQPQPHLPNYHYHTASLITPTKPKAKAQPPCPIHTPPRSQNHCISSSRHPSTHPSASASKANFLGD